MLPECNHECLEVVHHLLQGFIQQRIIDERIVLHVIHLLPQGCCRKECCFGSESALTPWAPLRGIVEESNELER